MHRIGRTGRVGNLGEAISFYTDKNNNVARELVDILMEAHQTVPDWLRDKIGEAHRHLQQKQQQKSMQQQQKRYQSSGSTSSYGNSGSSSCGNNRDYRQSYSSEPHHRPQQQRHNASPGSVTPASPYGNNHSYGNNNPPMASPSPGSTASRIAMTSSPMAQGGNSAAANDSWWDGN